MRKARVEWVRQEDAEGCGLAVLAMLTGRSYAEVKAKVDATEVGPSEAPRDWTTSGCTHYTLDRYLAAEGWFFQRRYESYAELPQEPFAPIHYAEVVQPSGRGHFVVVHADGKVLDPMREGRFRLSDWARVNQLVGLIALGRPAALASRPGGET